MHRDGTRCRAWLLAAAAVLLMSTLAVNALTTSMRVQVHGSQILVEGKPFFVKGVVYSPSPIGSHPGWTWPYGDFFIPQYADLWQRDFPLLKSLGANTIRVYGWNNELDHGYFLDTAHRAGLKVIVTFGLGNAWQNPVHEEWQRQQHLGRFTWQFRKYLNHPALLAWSFGEQMNLPSNGFLQAFNDAYQCGWNQGDYNVDPGGCLNNPDTSSSCAGPIACVYEHFFGFLNQAASSGKNIMGEKQAHLILTSISDVDLSWKRTQQFSYAGQNLDAWGLQIYRGPDFGLGKEDWLSNYEVGTPNNARGEKVGAPKPVIVVEYGIDAYRDPCGKSTETPCYNDAEDSGEDEVSQADWGASMSSILTAHSSASHPPRGAVAGGTILSWVDEAWKCTGGVGGCSGPIPYPLPGFDASQCSWKAHVQCPNMNLWRKTLCGYYTPAMPDHYANVGWFGLLRPSPQAGDVDRLTPRLLFGRLQEQWSGQSSAWGWILLLLASLGMATAITWYTYKDFSKRRAQVRELELRSSARSSAKGRSPLGVGAGVHISPAPMHPPHGSPPTDRRGNRGQPAGRSSRASVTSSPPVATPNSADPPRVSPIVLSSSAGGSPSVVSISPVGVSPPAFGSSPSISSQAHSPGVASSTSASPAHASPAQRSRQTSGDSAGQGIAK